ncbi:CBN-EAK-7 protein [Caenorhabditis brenneri]|uniref:MTOR-associated protein MEAK7 n=1 Tax=Caenorhabditis brenneri TaxID=135651 RepID=G0N6E9_CAEBE|nr:CBN-EAK-7 protein [Caenorhabditis brenneri]
MGAENSKRKKFKNIEDEEYTQFLETFKKATAGKDTMSREQFVATYTVLGEFSSQFYFRLLKNEPKGVLHAKTLLKVIDGGLGHFDTLAETLIFCFGDQKDQVMRNVVKIFCEANKFTREDQVRLYDYFETENTKPVTELEHFFSTCPLFPHTAAFIFQKLIDRPGDSKMPILSEKSQLMGNVDQLILNSHLPFDRRKEWTMLYSNTKHGQSFSQLVKRINGEGPCFIVMRSMRGRRFGFFASEGFLAGPQYRGSAECFLFQLAPKLATYSATGRTENYAYLNFQQQQHPNGIGIGGHETVWPLFIHEEFGGGLCQKNSSAFEPCYLAEEEEFKIKTIEAWRPGDKPQKSFEEQLLLESSSPERSIIDKDPEARAVLEMAGKSFKSEAYRDPAPMLDEK